MHAGVREPAQKAADTKDRDKSDKQKSAEPKGSDAKDQKAAGTKNNRNGSAATGAGAGASGRTAITTEQRQKVQPIFAKHRSSARVDVNIDVRVGTSVPRSVTLVAIPQDIVVIVPEYRRYKYFVVDDQVCIVDPDTYEIVEIIVIA